MQLTVCGLPGFTCYHQSLASDADLCTKPSTDQRGQAQSHTTAGK